MFHFENECFLKNYFGWNPAVIEVNGNTPLDFKGARSLPIYLIMILYEKTYLLNSLNTSILPNKGLAMANTTKKEYCIMYYGTYTPPPNLF